MPGFIRKQFIHDVNGGVAGGSYIWENLAAAKAFYNGPWLEGIRARYGCEPRVTYFETFAIADQATHYAGPPPGPLVAALAEPERVGVTGPGYKGRCVPTAGPNIRHRRPVPASLSRDQVC